MNKRILLSTILPLALASNFALAQFALESVGTHVIDFESPIPNTFGYHSLNAYGVLIDVGSPIDTGKTGLQATAWSAWASGVGIGGHPAGTWTPFTNDVNGNGNFGDNFVIAGAGTARGSSGMGGTQVGVLPEGGTGILLGQGNAAPWRDNGFTLRVINQSGSTLTDFVVGLQAWNGNPDNNISNFHLSYSTDNENFTQLTMLAGSRTTTETWDATNAAHWSSVRNVEEPIASLTLANEAELFLRFVSLRPSGSSGSNWVFDNISITAVPEPTTYATLFGAVVFGAVLLLRRRKA